MNRKVSLCLTTENDRQLHRKKSIIIGLSVAHGLEITKVTQRLPTNADEIKSEENIEDFNKNSLSNYVGIIEDEQMENLKATLAEQNLLIPVSDVDYYGKRTLNHVMIILWLAKATMEQC